RHGNGSPTNTRTRRSWSGPSSSNASGRLGVPSVLMGARVSVALPSRKEGEGGVPFPLPGRDLRVRPPLPVGGWSNLDGALVQDDLPAPGFHLEPRPMCSAEHDSVEGQKRF